MSCMNSIDFNKLFFDVIGVAQDNKTNELRVVSFFSKKESVSEVENLIADVCREHHINSSPTISYWNPTSLPQEIRKNKPAWLVLVSDLRDFKDELASSQDNRFYHDILKSSRDVGKWSKFLVDCEAHY